MMRKKMWMFCFLFWTAVRASEEPLYKKIGDKAVFRPDSVENPITSIRWKHGDNIAMQWNGDKTLAYRQFKDRGSLNISTGVLTITELTRDLSGTYTAEINGKETSETQLLVISPVPKPTISVSCVPEMTYCVFTCSGNITEPAPVTYWWTAGEKRWNSTNQHKITKDDKELWFSCIVENPVSSHSSEEVFNPFITYRTWIIIFPTVLLVILVVSIIIILYLLRKEKADNRTLKEEAARTNPEMRVMLLGVENTSNQDPTSVDVPDTSSGGEKPASPPLMKETSTKDPTSAAPPETSNEAGLKPQWQYERRRGGWWDFREMTDPPNGCSATSDDIESWYQKIPHDKMPFIVNGEPYALDFKEMIQTNLMTRYSCKIRRVML